MAGEQVSVDRGMEEGVLLACVMAQTLLLGPGRASVLAVTLLPDRMPLCRAQVDVPVELEKCWALWDDRERIPTWMPWIKSVKVGPGRLQLSGLPHTKAHVLGVGVMTDSHNGPRCGLPIHPAAPEQRRGSAWRCRILGQFACMSPHGAWCMCTFTCIACAQIQESDPRLSRWTLSTHQFGRDWEFSWLARNLAPVKNVKLHWVSERGSASLPGEGRVTQGGHGEAWCAVCDFMWLA